ncbi:hypothetical protein UACE39S_05788 [Ureibacillus acetophenoni]
MWADDASKIDMLAYEPYAKLVSEVAISERMSPLTIGLFGNWGSGKSTMLHLIEKNIKQQQAKKIPIVKVNAWMFEGYDDAKTALMESILQTIQEDKTFFVDSKEKIQNLVKRVDWIRLGGMALKKGIPLSLSLLAGNPLPMFLSGISKTSIDSEEEVEALLEKAANLKETYLKSEPENAIVNNIRKFREEFVDLINSADIDNLIIMIDDLDRCNPDRIIETLEAIKLFLAVEKTTFIISMDENVITYSIKKKYPQLDDVDIDISTDYIEKMVQLPVRIAELAETDIKNYMLLLVSEMYLEENSLNILIEKLKEKEIFIKGEIISARDLMEIIDSIQGGTNDNFKQGYSRTVFEEEIQIFNSIGGVIATTLKGNPRQTKRFLNTFYLRKRLAEIQRIPLNLAILAKLMVLEYIDRDLFKVLYQWQFENDGIPKPLAVIENAILESEAVEDQQNQESAWFGENIKRWIGVEPTNLSQEDLSKYFYLAKDSVSDKKLFSVNLSQQERKLINQICNLNLPELVRRKKIEELKDFDEVTRNEIFKGIVGKFNQDKEHLWCLIEIYGKYPQYRQKLLQEFKSLKKQDITPKVIILFKSLSGDIFNELKDYYVDEKKVSKRLWEIDL